MHDTALLARQLAALDIVTPDLPHGTIVIMSCRKKDGTFLRGVLDHNKKDRLVMRARLRRRSKIPSWHPDSEVSEWVEPIEKEKLTWLLFRVRTPKGRRVMRQPGAILRVEEPALVHTSN